MDSQRLIDGLATQLENEPRTEAAQTAAVLRDLGPRSLVLQQPPQPEYAPIRALLATSAHPAAPALLNGFALIPWGLNPVAAKAGANADIYLVAPLMGPEGPVPCADLRMGLFYQQPDCHYALHHHAADETYAILAGSATWTAGDDTRLRGVGDVVHHPSFMPHAFGTGAQGLLALWRWSGDIDTATYAMLDDPAVRVPA